MNSKSLSPSDRWLASFAALVIVATFALAAAFELGYHPIPRQSVCLSRLLFNRPCPGCGLTRSFIALGSGDLRRAIDLNPLGPVLFGMIGMLLLSRIGKFVTRPHKAWIALDVLLAIATLAALILRTVSFYLG